MQLRRGSYIMKMKIQRTAEEHPAAVFCGEGRIMKKFLLALLAFISISCPAFAVNWVQGGTLDDGTNWYLDTESVQRTEDEVKVWAKFEAPNGKRYTLRFTSFRKDKTMAELSVVVYDAKGRVLASQTPPYPNYTPVVPGSVGDYVYQLIFPGKDKLV